MYECHVTVDKGFAAQARKVAEDLKWKTSEITGDPVLGPDPWFYLTAHHTDAAAIYLKKDIAVGALVLAGVPVVRAKIERITYDTKTGIDEHARPVTTGEQRANATQVGGSHYAGDYQHWDLVSDLRLGYFEGQITKYLTRHRKKKGLEDVRKAQHFAHKLLELAQYRGRQPEHLFPTGDIVQRYRKANELNDAEMAAIMDVVTWRFVPDLHRLLSGIDSIIAKCYPVSGDAGPGYVNQDR